jgi:hypothetical protein
VLWEDIILLILVGEPALELCRLTNIGGEPDATLETECVLSLPKLTKSALLNSVNCFGEHPGHALFSKSRVPRSDSVTVPVFPITFMSTRHPPPPERLGPHRQLRPVPADGIISILLHIYGPPGHAHTRFRTIDPSVRCRTLLALTNNKPVQVMLRVPWEEWRPKNTRVLEQDSHMPDVRFGERRAKVGPIRADALHDARLRPFPRAAGAGHGRVGLGMRLSSSAGA